MSLWRATTIDFLPRDDLLLYSRVVRPRLTLNSLPLVATCHVALVAPGGRAWHFDAHSHDYVEAYCVIDGAAAHSGATEGTVVLTRGDVVLVPPGAWHAVGTDGERPLQLVNVAFPVSSWTRLLALACIPVPTGRVNLLTMTPVDEGERDRRVGSFTTLLDDMARPDPGLGLMRFLVELADICRPAAGSGSNRVTWLDKMLDVVGADDVIQGGLPELLDRVGISYGHLARVCRREFDLTPTQLVNRARVERAKVLLRTTTQPVVAVAHGSGFATVSHFYAVFERETTVSPGVYRESIYSGLRPASDHDGRA